MGDGGPDPTDPVWQAHFASPSVEIETGSGIPVQATAPQPAYDPNEPWSELPPLQKVSIPTVWDLIEALRTGGVPVLGPKPRRAGLFSKGLINVTLSVPTRLVFEATRIVEKQLGQSLPR